MMTMMPSVIGINHNCVISRRTTSIGKRALSAAAAAAGGNQRRAGGLRRTANAGPPQGREGTPAATGAVWNGPTTTAPYAMLIHTPCFPSRTKTSRLASIAPGQSYPCARLYSQSSFVANPLMPQHQQQQQQRLELERQEEVIRFPSSSLPSLPRQETETTTTQPVLLNSKEHAVGYLSKILNARVYDAAIETELQEAKNLSTVSVYVLVFVCVRVCLCPSIHHPSQCCPSVCPSVVEKPKRPTSLAPQKQSVTSLWSVCATFTNTLQTNILFLQCFTFGRSFV